MELVTEPMIPTPSLANPQVRISFTDLRSFTDVLAERTGFRFGPKRFGFVREVILKRMKALSMDHLDEYLKFAYLPENIDELKTVDEWMVNGSGPSF